MGLVTSLEKEMLQVLQTGQTGGIPWGLSQETAYIVRDLGSLPESGRSLKKEIASHSSTLAWTIPWTEKPGTLPWKQVLGKQLPSGHMLQLRLS